MQYQELARSPNPSDLWAGEARERLQLLVGKHPELMKAVTAPNPANGAAPPPKTAAPTLSAGPAVSLSASPAASSNAAPRLLQIPGAASNAAPH